MFRMQVYLECFVCFHSENTFGGNVCLCSPLRMNSIFVIVTNSTSFYSSFSCEISFQESLGVAFPESVWKSDLSFDLNCYPAIFYKRAESQID